MQPTIYRFKFGSFEIANNVDGKAVRRLQPAAAALMRLAISARPATICDQPLVTLV